MYEFTEEDLKYNKRGQLSPNQCEWLKMIARSTRRFSWKSAFITIGFAFVNLPILVPIESRKIRHVE